MHGTNFSEDLDRLSFTRFVRFDRTGRHAVSTPGDVLFHVRAKRMDMCFELVTHIMERIKDAVSVVDEVHGFRYFDDRDVIGFVDGTENPRGGDAYDAALVGQEDAQFRGGSYVIIQKYLHDMEKLECTFYRAAGTHHRA